MTSDTALTFTLLAAVSIGVGSVAFWLQHPQEGMSPLVNAFLSSVVAASVGTCAVIVFQVYLHS
jgi:hypothetical protein